MASMKPYIWLCPHEQITHKEARKMLLYCPPDVDDEYIETLPPCPKCSDHISTSLQHKFQGQHTLALRTEVTLFSARDYPSNTAATRCFSRDRVALALSTLDLPLCAHMSASDSDSWWHQRYYCFQLEALGQPAEKCVCHFGFAQTRPHGAHYKHCEACYDGGTCTQFGFIAREKVLNARRVLFYMLVIFRDLGSCLRERKDEIPQAWLMHTSLNFFRHAPAELEKTWTEWVRFMDKRAKKWANSEKYSVKGSLGYKLNSFRAMVRWTNRIHGKDQEEYWRARKEGGVMHAAGIVRAARKRDIK